MHALDIELFLAMPNMQASLEFDAKLSTLVFCLSVVDLTGCDSEIFTPPLVVPYLQLVHILGTKFPLEIKKSELFTS